MKIVFAAVAMLLVGVSVAEAAPLYECAAGDTACQAKRSRMSSATYNRKISGCLASAGATRAQWRAHAVPRAQADIVRACLTSGQ